MNAFLNAHPNFRSALRVSVYSFLGVFVPALLGWLGNVNEWVGSDGAVFPSVSILTKAAISATTAALSGLIAYVYNRLPVGADATYGTPNPPPPPDNGGVPENYEGEFP